MMLNDDIIDCFTEKSITLEQKKEIDTIAEEIKEINTRIIETPALHKSSEYYMSPPNNTHTSVELH